MRFWRGVKVWFGFDFGVLTSAIWLWIVVSCRVRFWYRVEWFWRVIKFSFGFGFGVVSSAILVWCRVRF